MQSAMREALLSLDTGLLRRLWAHIAPHLPQPASETDTLTAAHIARTAADSLPLRARAYSHRWLTERGLPSRLPDPMKPHAERLYPRVVTSVGISANSKYDVVREAIGGAMRDAVLDCYANGDEAPEIVKPRMMEARSKEQIALGLRSRWSTLIVG
jgi:hypothetical protein